MADCGLKFWKTSILEDLILFRVVSLPQHLGNGKAFWDAKKLWKRAFVTGLEMVPLLIFERIHEYHGWDLLTTDQILDFMKLMDYVSGLLTFGILMLTFGIIHCWWIFLMPLRWNRLRRSTWIYGALWNYLGQWHVMGGSVKTTYLLDQHNKFGSTTSKCWKNLWSSKLHEGSICFYGKLL